MGLKLFSGLGDIGNLLVDYTTDTPKSLSSAVGGNSVLQNIDLTVYSDISDKIINDFSIEKSEQRKTVSSKESKPAHFSTIDNNLKLEAIPYYNFWTEDEETNDSIKRERRDLSLLPRYVKLKWRPLGKTNNPPVFSRQPATDKRVRMSSMMQNKTTLATNTRGISFDKNKLDNFSIYRSSVVNGFISPGTISAIVESPAERSSQKIPKIDERKYLLSDMTDGISIHDIQTNINSSIFSNNKNVSKKIQNLKNELVDGKYSVLKSLEQDISGKGISVISTNGKSAAIGMNLRTAEKNVVYDTHGKSTVSELNKIIADVITIEKTVEEKKQSLEVFFNDPAITGIVSEEKSSLAKAPEHAENIIGLAPYIANLCILSELDENIKRRQKLPSFPSVKDDEGTEYIGYVIQKFRQSENGVFNLVKEIEIPDRDCFEYIDTEVVYGGIYRYRIKSILRWVRPAYVNHKTTGNRSGNRTNDTRLVNYEASYFQSEWNREWQYASITDNILPPPPDEFTVRPESNKKRAVISWKLPYNPQKDIHYYILYKKIQDENGKDITDWKKVDVRFGALNCLVFDNDVEYFDKSGNVYVYAAQTVTKHNEYSLLSSQRGVRLNSNVFETGEYPIKNVSSEGASLESTGAFEKSPAIKIKGNVKVNKKVTFLARPGNHSAPFLNKTFCVRFKSLDSGESKDVIINIDYDNVAADVKKYEKIDEIRQSISSINNSSQDSETKIRDFLNNAFSSGEIGVSSTISPVRRNGVYTTLNKLLGSTREKLK